MAEWHKISFTKGAQVIPAVCPNCMAPAVMKVRTTYYFLNQRLTQTFNYCEPCGQQADAAPSMIMSAIGGLILSVPVAMGFIFAVFPRLPEGVKNSAAAGMFPMLLMACGVVGLPWLLRSRARKKYPLREGQAGWGPAVYFTGFSAFGWGGGACYKALRPDWLKEFARLNADQVKAG